MFELGLGFFGLAATDFWGQIGNYLTVTNLLEALNGIAPVLASAVLVGLVIYFLMRISKRMSKGKGGF